MGYFVMGEMSVFDVYGDKNCVKFSGFPLTISAVWNIMKKYIGIV